MTQAETATGSIPRQVAARPWVRAWLLVVVFSIFAIVLVGGATRLTESGLSITEWQPVTGVLPPMSEDAWQEAFDKYRQIPQYQRVNRGMSLDEFKTIFWWEWAHRLVGRLIGVIFLVPFLVFLLSGRIERTMVPWLAGALVLGGLQGALGWYMVASGLVERTTVSQYRLAAHLTMAAVIFSYLLWLADSLRQRAAEPAGPVRLRIGALLLLALVFVQFVLGALVAGLRAGLAYRSWPLMDGKLVPDGLMMMEPWWINLFENITTVQFDHRMVGYLIVVATILHALDARWTGSLEAARRAMWIAIVAVVQVCLGVATLLTGVHIHVALAHQAVAMLLLALLTVHVRRVWVAARQTLPAEALRRPLSA